MARESWHPVDLVSLVGGLLSLLVAGAFLVGDLTRFDPRPDLLAPLAVVGLGAAALGAALRRLRPQAAQVPGDQVRTTSLVKPD